MAYTVKGNAGPVVQDRRFQYEPEDGTYIIETTFGGSARAIEGQSLAFRQKNRAHISITEPNGIGQTVLRTPLAPKPEELENTVRYEIGTEFLEQDLFRHKAISDVADADDATIVGDAPTFRKRAEDAGEKGNVDPLTIFGRTVTHLRKGITGFEREYIVLRRSRKLPYFGLQSVPKAAILEGRFIYSTEQLGLPQAIAFSLPTLADLPAAAWSDVKWGWRRRPSNVVFSGNFIEQSSEFILAEWSLLLYQIATEAATW